MKDPVKEKLHHYQRRVTWFTWNYVAELLFFLAKCADAMLDPAIRLYIYKSLCIIDYGYKVNCNDPAITLKPHQEEAIQTLAAYYISMYKLSVNLPSAALGLFCGAWSDKVGRKLPVLISCFGATISALLALISTSKARYAVPLIMFSALVRGTCGKSNIISMALCSYVTDTTEITQRTTRMGYLLAMNYFGYFVGSTLLGSLLELSTIPVVFCVFIGINLLIVIVSVLFLREDTNRGYYEYRRQSLAPHSQAPLEENSAFTKDGRYKITKAEIEPDKVEDVGKDTVACYECNTLLQWKNVVDTVDVLLRKR